MGVCTKSLMYKAVKRFPGESLEAFKTRREARDRLHVCRASLTGGISIKKSTFLAESLDFLFLNGGSGVGVS